MTLSNQLSVLASAGFTVNMLTSPSEQEGKLSVTFLLSGDNHLDPKGLMVAKQDIIHLLKRSIQIVVSPEELEATVIKELQVVVDERVPIATSIMEEYEAMKAKLDAKKKTPAKRTTTTKKKTKAQEAKEQARAKAEKASGELPLFQSDRSAKAKESLKQSLKPEEEEVIEL